jgi:quercetin dioxygenase-like cupin family protein
MQSQIETLRHRVRQIPPDLRLKDLVMVISKANDDLPIHGLMKQPGVSVAWAEMKDGDVFEWHAHAETEVVIVWQGSLMLEVSTTKQLISPGELFRMTPMTEHQVTAIGDVKCVAVMVPASPEFPDGP